MENKDKCFIILNGEDGKEIRNFIDNSDNKDLKVLANELKVLDKVGFKFALVINKPIDL